MGWGLEEEAVSLFSAGAPLESALSTAEMFSVRDLCLVLSLVGAVKVWPSLFPFLFLSGVYSTKSLQV